MTREVSLPGGEYKHLISDDFMPGDMVLVIHRVQREAYETEANMACWERFILGIVDKTTKDTVFLEHAGWNNGVIGFNMHFLEECNVFVNGNLIFRGAPPVKRGSSMLNAREMIDGMKRGNV